MEADFQHGIDLLNARSYYEAHEALEDAWRAAPAESRRFYQGIVQIAVALHHFSHGNLRGARSVMRRAAGNLQGCSTDFAALDMDNLRAQLVDWCACLEDGAPQPPWPVVRRISEADDAARE